ncbi:pyridoxamine 5'-phosphate oxidase family protein [Streptomyces sp. URMC 123]|uniref:pyridoxamine 5'-phosphate oxidase family protein n=1 Tax=Streptomyces sp. URMC 123 TaxID=3423403 RepID=UPI003F1A18D1
MTPEEFRAFDLLHRTPYGRLSTSRRALPFTTVARHVVAGGTVLLRLHRGYNYHQSCDGNVVAYEADNLDQVLRDEAAARAAGALDPLAAPHPLDGPAHLATDVWTAQFVGTAHLLQPTDRQRELFGPTPLLADNFPFEPVYLRIEPQFITIHSLSGVPSRQSQYSG